jgi:hypothetical protein
LYESEALADQIVEGLLDGSPNSSRAAPPRPNLSAALFLLFIARFIYQLF